MHSIGNYAMSVFELIIGDLELAVLSTSVWIDRRIEIENVFPPKKKIPSSLQLKSGGSAARERDDQQEQDGQRGLWLRRQPHPMVHLPYRVSPPLSF